MTTTESRLGDVTVFSLRGDIVLGAAAPTLADTMRRAADQGHRHVLIDLSHVRHIDSWGLAELVQCLVVVSQRGGGVRLIGVTKRLNDLLILTRLLTAFECVDTVEEGVGSFVPALVSGWRPATLASAH